MSAKSKWSGVLLNAYIGLFLCFMFGPLIMMSAALLLNRLEGKFSSLLYGILVASMLIPGIVLGISTILFWQEFGVVAGMNTAMLAQTTFIASYPMLILMARLRRQDQALEEAALDPGPTPSSSSS